jgi:hypothetical protein
LAVRHRSEARDLSENCLSNISSKQSDEVMADQFSWLKVVQVALS